MLTLTQIQGYKNTEQNYGGWKESFRRAARSTGANFAVDYNTRPRTFTHSLLDKGQVKVLRLSLKLNCFAALGLYSVRSTLFTFKFNLKEIVPSGFNKRKIGKCERKSNYLSVTGRQALEQIDVVRHYFYLTNLNSSRSLKSITLFKTTSNFNLCNTNSALQLY